MHFQVSLVFINESLQRNVLRTDEGNFYHLPDMTLFSPLQLSFLLAITASGILSWHGEKSLCWKHDNIGVGHKSLLYSSKGHESKGQRFSFWTWTSCSEDSCCWVITVVDMSPLVRGWVCRDGSIYEVSKSVPGVTPVKMRFIAIRCYFSWNLVHWLYNGKHSDLASIFPWCASQPMLYVY